MVRTGLTALLLLALVPVAILADLSVWVTRTVVDERAFTTTVATALDTPAFEEAIAGAVADTLTQRIEDLDPTVRAAGAAALGVPDQRAAIRAWLGDRLVPIMGSTALIGQRDALIAAGHAVLIGGASPTGPIRIVGGNVVLDAGGVQTVIADALDPTGAAAPFLRLTSAEQLVVLAPATRLEQVTTTIHRLRLLLPILAILMVVLALLAIASAHHRARAVGGVGMALALAGGAGLAGAWLADQVVGAFIHAPVTRDAIRQIVASLTGVLALQSALLVIAGVALLVMGWSIGRDQQRRAVAQMFDPLD
jgi:hypothetical protein